MVATKKETAAKKPKRSDFDLPAILGFRRAIEITDGLFCAEKTVSGETVRADVSVFDHGQRTTASHDSTKDRGDTQRSGEDSRNLIYGQQAKLPRGFDTLVVSTALRILPIRCEPDSCDSDVWHKAITAAIENAKSEIVEGDNVLGLLSRYYAYNLANGSWLWRNRDVSDDIVITIRFGSDVVVIENALDLALRPVLGAGSEGGDPHAECSQIDGLASAICEAFSGKRRSLRIEVEAKAKMLPGQSVWPSQLFMPVKRVIDREAKTTSGRDFYMVDGVPAITAEKIGNALRTFDRDHGHHAYLDAVIPAEPNGGSLRYGINLRGKGKDIRSLLGMFVGIRNGCSDPAPCALPKQDVLYILACIIRGGLFGGAVREDKNTGDRTTVSAPAATLQAA